jgi:hypothetical protein
MAPFINPSRRQILCLMVAGLAGYANIVRSQKMDVTEKHFKGFAQLEKLALKFITNSQGERYRGGPRQSLPVPVHHQNKLLVAFMFYPARSISYSAYLLPPYKVGWLDPITGERIDEAQVSPADFGQTDESDKGLPEWNTAPPNVNLDKLASLRKQRLPELYDMLFAAWATDPSSSGHSNLRDQAREFLKVFYQISEPPLKPYYESLGRDWFGWLRKLAE